MKERFLVLERSLQEDLKAVEEIYAELAPAPLSGAESQDDLIVVAFRLHALYSALENIFSNIAKAFENTLDDSAGWHTELLRRMRLDLRPVRPAVIDAETYEALDELRGFRHDPLLRLAVTAGLLQAVWGRHGEQPRQRLGLLARKRLAKSS